MNKKVTLILVMNLAVSIAVLAALIFLIWGKKSPEGTPEGERFRRLAALYEANDFPGPAVFTYERYLESATIEPKEEAKVHYILGNLYYEKLMNHESAVLHYLAAEDLNPEASWKTEVQKRIITCFERLGRTRDAQNRLDAGTALVSRDEDDDSPLLAKVGTHEIRLRDLEDAVAQMPPEMRDRLKGPEGVRPILDRMIREWLLYDLAQRKGLADDPQIRNQLKKYRRMFLANLAFQMEMDSRIQVTEDDLKNYYEDNKENIRDQEGNQLDFEQVREQVLMQIKSAKARELEGPLMQELEKLEGVTIHEDNIPR